ncbi:sensor histidine kinase [Oceanobacillus halophilus]|uniref:histidine kinase n=1 Tax=Oceanobacillus halophilus TaxID=930130 RepID=A0A495A4T4_9BACI|nr:HAMP domain-containing sensor histidine kinase [Oceanobacillus halophilus]RKQ34658.1 sensor histidine kinase [Oceanobacillus halophilus]
MIYIVIILSLATIFVLTRIYALKKEVKKIHKQLRTYNNRKTNKKIDMALFDKDVEELGLEINRLMDSYVTENRRRVQFENEHRQAVANMSHDLRTPLTSIIGYIQMANSKEIEEDEKAELLSIAAKRGKRLETLLNEFFELSVIESADYHLKTERINLRNLTVDVLMSFYDRFQEKKMEPNLDLPENDVFLVADTSALTRVIENLLSNAINHSEGNISISLEENHTKVKLMVKNNANTLTQQDATRMFDRFYMADQSRSGKNTGLGLSIVKSFMEKMNGTIRGQLDNGQLSIICEWETGKDELEVAQQSSN